MEYHVGLVIRGRTLVIQARQSVDFLDCELYDYMGPRETTKRRLYANRYEILKLAQANRPQVYGRLRWAIVD